MTDNNVKVLAVDGQQVTLGISRPFKIEAGERIVIEYKKWKQTRTLPQNAYFHALIGEISMLTGMDRELIKAGIKEQYGNRLKVFDSLIPKPSHLCDTQDMALLIQGAELELACCGGDVQLVKFRSV